MDRTIANSADPDEMPHFLILSVLSRPLFMKDPFFPDYLAASRLRCPKGRLSQMSSDMRFPTMWYVRPAKPQISLRIRTF